jgi:hypothetical protein
MPTTPASGDGSPAPEYPDTAPAADGPSCAAPALHEPEAATTHSALMSMTPEPQHLPTEPPLKPSPGTPPIAMPRRWHPAKTITTFTRIECAPVTCRRSLTKQRRL